MFWYVLLVEEAEGLKHHYAMESQSTKINARMISIGFSMKILSVLQACKEKLHHGSLSFMVIFKIEMHKADLHPLSHWQGAAGGFRCLKRSKIR